MRSATRKQISEEARKDIRNIFRVFDAGKEGFITLQEVGIALNALDLPVTKEEMVRLSDKAPRGVVAFNDFYTLAAQKMARRRPEDEYHRAFKLFDTRGVGYITFEDLQRKTHEVGEFLTDDELNEMIKEADGDGDGHVSEEDFIRMLQKTERLLTKSTASSSCSSSGLT